MQVTFLCWISFLLKVNANYIINLYPSRTASHDKRIFPEYTAVCKQPIIASADTQMEWQCSEQMIGELGYPRGTTCRSKCLRSASRLHGTSQKITCVDRRPQHGKTGREWNPKPLFCKPDTCKTGKIKNDQDIPDSGHWEPEECQLQQKVMVGTECRFLCKLSTMSHSWSTPTARCENGGRWNLEHFNKNTCDNSFPITTANHISLQGSENEGSLERIHTENTAKQVKGHVLSKTNSVILAGRSSLTHELKHTNGLNDEHTVDVTRDVVQSPSHITLLVIVVSLTLICVCLLTMACYAVCRRNRHKRNRYTILNDNGGNLLRVNEGNINNNSKSTHRPEWDYNTTSAPNNRHKDMPECCYYYHHPPKCCYKSSHYRNHREIDSASNSSERSSTSSSESIDETRPSRSKQFVRKKIKEIKFVLK